MLFAFLSTTDVEEDGEAGGGAGPKVGYLVLFWNVGDGPDGTDNCESRE